MSRQGTSSATSRSRSSSSKAASARNSRPQSSSSSSGSHRHSHQRSSRSIAPAEPFNALVEQAELQALQASIVFPTAAEVACHDTAVCPPPLIVNDLISSNASLADALKSDGASSSFAAAAATPSAATTDSSTSAASAETNTSNASAAPTISTPRLRFETFHHKIDYRYDGDRTMDTDVMLAKRRRLKQDRSIQTWINVFWRTFHHIKKGKAAGGSEGEEDSGDESETESNDPFSSASPTSSSAASGDSAASSSLPDDPFAERPLIPATTAEEPLVLNVANERKRFALAGSIDRRTYLKVHSLWFKALHKLYDREDAHAQAIRDWARDSWLSMCRDQDELDHHAFSDALFELVDLWTLTVEPQEYVHFLATLYHRVTRVKTWLADDSSILTKYVWRKTKFVKPSAVYRPYQYNKYKQIQWKQAADVIHHLYSDSDSDQDENDADDADDAVIRDLTALTDDEAEESDEEEEESEDEEEEEDDSESNSLPSSSSSARGRMGTLSSAHQQSGIMEWEATITASRTPSPAPRTISPSIVPPLSIDAAEVLRNLPAVNLEPPMSPYLDPPAFIPPTPSGKGGRYGAEDDDDNDQFSSRENGLLSRADEKMKAKLESAIDALDQRREERYLKMIDNFKTLLERQNRRLRRSNSVVCLTRAGNATRDVDPSLFNIGQHQKVATSPPSSSSSSAAVDESPRSRLARVRPSFTTLSSEIMAEKVAHSLQGLSASSTAQDSSKSALGENALNVAAAFERVVAEDVRYQRLRRLNSPLLVVTSSDSDPSSSSSALSSSSTSNVLILSHSIHASARHLRRLSAPCEIASFVCLPPRCYAEGYRPSLNDANHASAFEDDFSEDFAGGNAGDEDEEEEDDHEEGGVSHRSDRLKLETQTRPETSDMPVEDFEAYMASLETPRKDASTDLLPPGSPLAASLSPSSSNKSFSMSSPRASEIQSDSSRALLTTPALDGVQAPPSTAVSDTRGKQVRLKEKTKVSSPVVPASKRASATSTTSRSGSPAPVVSKKEKLKKSEAGAAATSHSLASSSASLDSRDANESSDSEASADSASSSSSSSSSSASSASSPPAATRKPDQLKQMMSSLLSGNRGSKKVAQRLVDARDVKKSDIEHKKIRDDALAHEYDEDSIKARDALRNGLNRMMEDDDEQVAAEREAEEGEKDGDNKEVAKVDPLPAVPLSLSERQRLAQEERARAQAAHARELEERHRQEEEERQRRRLEESRFESEAASKAARAENELFSLLQEADRQRQIEASLKAQKKEIAKKEKEARRKLREERGEKPEEEEADKEEEQGEEVSKSDDEEEEAKGSGTRVTFKSKGVEFAPENEVFPTESNDSNASDARRLSRASSAAASSAKESALARKKADDAAAQTALARRKAERAEEERLKQEAIQERTAAEVARAEAARSNTEKKVLKARSKGKKEEEESPAASSSASASDSGVKIRPDFLKARKLDKMQEEEEEQEGIKAVASATGSKNEKGASPSSATSSSRSFSASSTSNSSSSALSAPISSPSSSSALKSPSSAPILPTASNQDSQLSSPASAMTGSTSSSSIKQSVKSIPSSAPSLASSSDSPSSAPSSKLESAASISSSVTTAASSNATESLHDAGTKASNHEAPSSKASVSPAASKIDSKAAASVAEAQDAENGELNAEDAALAAAEAQKYSFGADWTLEKKRAFREAEFAAEKRAEREALAKSGELGLAELKWNTAREKIKREEEKVLAREEKQKEMQALKVQKEEEQAKKKLEKEKMEQEKAEAKKQKQRENHRVAEEKRNQQRADLAAKKRPSASSTSNSSSSSTTSSSLAPSTLTTTRRQSISGAPTSRSEPELVDSSDISTSDRQRAVLPAAEPRRASTLAPKRGSAVLSSASSSASASSLTPSVQNQPSTDDALQDDNKLSLSADSSSSSTLSSVQSPASQGIYTPAAIVKENSSAFKAVVRSEQESKRDFAMRRREAVLARVEAAKEERRMRAELQTQKRLEKEAAKLAAAAARQQELQIEQERRVAAEIARKAAEEAPFFHAMPARRAAYLSGTRDEDFEVLVDANVEPRDSEIKYWSRVDLEEAAAAAGALSPRQQRALLEQHALEPLQVPGVDSEAEVRLQLAALRRGPPQRSWGLSLAKESEPLVCDEHTLQLPLSHDIEVEDWQSRSARALLAKDVQDNVTEARIAEGADGPAPPLSARKLFANSSEDRSMHEVIIEPWVVEENRITNPDRSQPEARRVQIEACAEVEVHLQVQSDPDYESDHARVLREAPSSLEAHALMADARWLPVSESELKVRERQHEAQHETRAMLATLLESSEHAVLGARVRRFHFLEELMTAVKARNERKRCKKSELDARTAAFQQELRRALEADIAQWKARKSEIFATSQSLRQEQNRAKLEARAASLQRQQQLKEEEESARLYREQALARKEQRRLALLRERQIEREDRREAHLKREHEALERRQQEQEKVAEARRLLEVQREQRELQAIAEAQERERVKLEEAARVEKAAQEYRANLQAEREKERAAAQEEAQRLTRQQARQDVLKALKELQEALETKEMSAHQARTQLNESQRKRSADTLQLFQQRRDAMMVELKAYHRSRRVQIEQIEAVQRRLKLEEEERRREEVIVLRLSKKRAAAVSMPALQEEKESNASLTAPIKSPIASTALTHDEKIVDQLVNPAPRLSTFLSSQQKESNASVQGASLHSIELIRRRMLAEKSKRETEAMERSLRSSEEEKCEFVNPAVHDETSMSPEDAKMFKAEVEAALQLDREMQMRKIEHRLQESLQRTQLEHRRKLLIRAGSTVPRVNALCITGPKRSVNELSLPLISAVAKKSDVAAPRHGAGVLSPPARAKLIKERELVADAIGSSYSLINQREANKLMWGNNREEFQLIGQKQRAFYRDPQRFGATSTRLENSSLPPINSAFKPFTNAENEILEADAKVADSPIARLSRSNSSGTPQGGEQHSDSEASRPQSTSISRSSGDEFEAVQPSPAFDAQTDGTQEAEDEVASIRIGDDSDPNATTLNDDTSDLISAST